ncbi:hypothetical protein TVAG_029390 [Trichomonas vaginalis G3]|uniref:Uncharacterized protein n=1 Tax=Trichomonas vaginalis (strain ATCC PRA-98 / G3) TaxID=412133 RepID=A2G944_TRIV3|nr:hypothetical protein TVAGG3_0926040 [Trichomonas vaginalis G3]EAX86317.1 hypothetical protein TVAG_029390 [Trichomonas vaginalis G3]KAI5485481.1 hypothetical protein TVAGG3_0926040 [Trichomonas vaginalis G3]|eukprot:XP_001299247.1 hypothetical protein [Trichomonas vaginalis G3]
MESIFEPISQIIERADPNSKEIIDDVVNNFISSFSFTTKSLVLANNDPEFARLIKNLAKLMVKTIIKDEKCIELIILKFFIRLCKLPHLTKIVSQEINLDLLISMLFNEESLKKEAVYAEYFHLISLLTINNIPIITNRSTFDTLFKNIYVCLQVPEIRYWALITTNNFARNSQQFMSFLRMNHNFNPFKRLINDLLISEDRNIIGAAFSAATALSPITEDFQTAFIAAQKLCESDNPRELFLASLSQSILQIEKDNGISSALYCALFISLGKSCGIDASEAANALTQMNPIYCEQLTKDEIRTFIMRLINIQEGFVSLAHCGLLYKLVDAVPEYISALRDPFDIFYSALQNYMRYDPSITSTETYMSLLYIMRLFLNSPGIKDKLLVLLTDHQEYIFSEFERRITQENSALSASLFHFLMDCSLFIGGWTPRIKQIIVNSKFASLLCISLLSSNSKREISSALLAMQLLLTDNSTQYIFFEQFTDSIYKMNSKAYFPVENIEDALRKEQKSREIEITDYTLKNINYEKTIEELKKKYYISQKQVSKLENTIHELNRVNKLKDQDLKNKDILISELNKKIEGSVRQVANSKEDNAKLAQKINYYKKKVTIINDCLNENRSLKSQNEILSKKVDTILTQNGTLEAQLTKFKEAFDQQNKKYITTAKKTADLEVQIEKLSKKNAILEKDLASSVSLSEKQKIEIIQVTSLRDEWMGKSTKFDELNQSLIKENNELKATIESNNSVIESTTKQIEILKQTVENLKKENKKLCGYVTFDNRVITAQKQTVEKILTTSK